MSRSIKDPETKHAQDRPITLLMRHLDMLGGAETAAANSTRRFSDKCCTSHLTSDHLATGVAELHPTTFVHLSPTLQLVPVARFLEILVKIRVFVNFNP